MWMLSQFCTLVVIAVRQLFSLSKFVPCFSLLKVGGFLDCAVAMVYDALQTSTRLLSERWLHFRVYSVFLEEKCAIDKLLWRQQKAFVAHCYYPPLRGRKPCEVGWALPPRCFEFQAFILLTLPRLLVRSPVVAADGGAKRNAALEQKDAKTSDWMGPVSFSARSRARFSCASVPVSPSPGWPTSPTYVGGLALFLDARLLCVCKGSFG